MIIVALGANLPSNYGEPEQTLEAAKSRLNENGVRIIGASNTWITEPVPKSNQENYRNAALVVETELKADELLWVLQKIEADFGRVRENQNDARTLDLDLIAYHDQVLSTLDLILPHPRMHERHFVLGPLSEIAPLWQHPIQKKTIIEMLNILGPDQTSQIIQKEAAA